MDRKLTEKHGAMIAEQAEAIWGGAHRRAAACETRAELLIEHGHLAPIAPS
jgi:hypothetical protein